MDMAFLKRICTVTMLMLLTIYYAESTMQDSRFSFNHPPIKKLIEPLSYDITLELPSVEHDFTYRGVSRNNIVIENPTSKIHINTLGLTIQQGHFRLYKYPYKGFYYPANYYYSNETETFIFDFETDVPSGFYNIYIKFRGNISENEIGFYRATCEDCNGGAKESHLEYNDTLHPIDHKFNVSVNVASMIALQWFGNLVSPTWWTDMWFFQTLALFYGAKAVAETYPDENIRFMFTYHLQSLARGNDAVSKMHPVTYEGNNRDEIDKSIKSFHFTNCLKEYAIMVMLENVVTGTIFRRAAMKYLEERQFSSATPNDFWNAIQDEIDKGKQLSLQHHVFIVEVVQSWLNQRSLPVMTAMRKFDEVIFRQENMNAEEDCDNNENLLIPINYVKGLNPGHVSSMMWFKCGHGVSALGIHTLDWVIFNWQNAGYYRIKYDSWALQRLTYCLDSEDHEKIHVFNRAHIIEDAHYFWSRNELSTISFHELMSFMRREKQCAPWYAMQKVFQKMRAFLNIKAGESTKDFIIRDILNVLLMEVGYTEHPDDAECVKFKRLMATKWACQLSDDKCLKIAKQRLIEHFEDPESHIIPPMWEEWTYCNGLVRSNISTWKSVFREFRKTKNTGFLKYLVCSGNITTILNYLDLVMSNNPLILRLFGFNSEDNRKIYRSIVKKHVWDDKVLDFLLKKLTEKDFDGQSFVEELSYVIENVYSLAQMEKISSLLDESHYDTNSLVYRILARKILRQKFRIYKL